MKRVGRLLEAAGRRRGGDQILEVGAIEHGTMRAIMRAFGEHPPPLPRMEDMEGEAEEDIRRRIVMRIVNANQ